MGNGCGRKPKKSAVKIQVVALAGIVWSSVCGRQRAVPDYTITTNRRYKNTKKKTQNNFEYTRLEVKYVKK